MPPTLNTIKVNTSMLLVLTTKVSPTSDALMHIFYEREYPAFRFNMDMFNNYMFYWDRSGFKITSPGGLTCLSREISGIVCYHARMTIDQHFDGMEHYNGESKWVISWLNHLHDCIIAWGMRKEKIKLFTPAGIVFSKTLQMDTAKKYFSVPHYYLHWGMTPAPGEVIVKSLTQRPFSDGSTAYAKIVDRNTLSPQWPWFTQEIAPGDRDATVLYINGHIHSYKFATVRGELTDWRVTQGTERNRWEPWAPGRDFERKIDAYMKEMNLKYGRLDFIIGGKEPQFLEVNPCGQFGWLDDEKHTLHHEVVDAILDPSSTVSG